MARTLDAIGITGVGGRCQIPPADNDINPVLPAYCRPLPVPNADSNLWNTEGGMSVLNKDATMFATLCPPWSSDIGAFYKPPYNFFVPDFLSSNLATLTSDKPAGMDLQGVFAPIIRTYMAEYLTSVGGNALTIYNGSTFGLFLNSQVAMSHNLSTYFLNLLGELDVFNNSSYDLQRILTAGVKSAVAQGKLNTVLPSLINEMTIPLQISPNGRPEKGPSPGENRVTALQFVENNRIPLKACVVCDADTGMAQRVKQRYWVPPTDINLRVPVHLRDGEVVGVPVKDRCGIEVPTVSSCWHCDRIPYPRLVKCDHAVVKNATCMRVWKAFRWVDYGDYTVSTAGEWCYVNLKSNIDSAYVLEQPHLSTVYGLLDDAVLPTPAQYGFDMTVSSLYQDHLEETSGTGERIIVFDPDTASYPWTIKPLYQEAYLVTLDCATVSATRNISQDFRSTKARYNLVWETGDASSVFESAVSAYSGPRNTIYVDVKDPWLKHFVDSKNVEVTYTDLDIDNIIEGLYPRRINRDMLIIPVDKYAYNPAYGHSTLDQYDPREPIVKRTLSTFLNPIPEIYNKYYTKAIPKEDDRGICGEVDLFAIQFSKGFDTSSYESSVFYEGRTTATDYNILGKIINKIDLIKANYSLDYINEWYAMSQVDLLSFFTLNEVTEFFLRLPFAVRADLFAGVFNNTKILDIPNIATEDSYLTSARLTGTDLSGDRNFITVPDINGNYYPPEGG